MIRAVLALALALCVTVQLTPGHLQRVVDGDTVDLHQSIGVSPPRERVRLLGVDAPERGHEGFFEAMLFADIWLRRGVFELTACKRDSFGRLLAWVWRGADTLNRALLANGHAVPSTIPDRGQ